jgi:uncharacterized protein (TIGR00255 family)
MNSMTGFGTGQISENDILVSCEMRSVNHKTIDVKVRLPREYASFEINVVDSIKKNIVRGRIDTAISVSYLGEAQKRLSLDHDLLTVLCSEIQNLEPVFPQINSQVTIGELLQIPGVLVQETETLGSDKLPDCVSQAVMLAIQDLKKSRAAEGESLRRVLENQIERCETLLEEVTLKAVKKPEALKARLEEKLKLLEPSIDVDPDRLAQEVLILIERMDVTEELDRLRIHLGHFRDFLEHDGTIGRKMDFLCQELFREVNTLGNKISDAQIAYLVVEFKSELQRIREQVQNIE